MNIFRQVKTVLWSFIGIGGRGREGAEKPHPIVLIAIAFVLVVLFLGVLVVVAKKAAGV